MTAVPGSPPEPRTPLPQGPKAVLVRRLPLLRLMLLRRDYLRDSGWAASGRQGAPVDRDGAPIPWYTYPAVHFLEGRVRADMEVFEYGSGNSTLWWADRVAHVAAVESDPHWVELLRPRLPQNVDLRLESADGAGTYVSSVTGRGRTFDVVVIDGMERNRCAHACLPALKDGGVILWDNADWTALWAEGMDHLGGRGFRRIEFHGLGPIAWRPWTTTVFYRPGDNCLGI